MKLGSGVGGDRKEFRALPQWTLHCFLYSPFRFLARPNYRQVMSPTKSGGAATQFKPALMIAGLKYELRCWSIPSAQMAPSIASTPPLPDPRFVRS